jgi:hypothetical protein
MGILDHYKAKSKGEWKAADGLVLEYDFDHHSLSEVKLRDPVSLLWKFGPPEDAAMVANGSYRYYSKGFEVNINNGKVVGFVVIWQDHEGLGFQPFPGKCRFRGQEAPVHAGLSETEVTAIFGPPFWRDESAAEVVLFYDNYAIEWQFEIARKTGLAALVIQSPALLAENESV